MKLIWNNLNKEERAEYMRLQMSPSGGYDRSGYLPDDCGECGACGEPMLGSGWCNRCSKRFSELNDKLRGMVIAHTKRRGKMENELLLTPEEIVIKVWNMALASVSPNADHEGYQIVRTNTLEWARDEIKAQLAKVKQHYEQEKIVLIKEAYQRGYSAGSLSDGGICGLHS